MIDASPSPATACSRAACKGRDAHALSLTICNFKHFKRRPGRDAKWPADSGYRAAIYLDHDYIPVDDRHEQIKLGMRVAVEIKTGERQVMQAVSEAGRER